MGEKVTFNYKKIAKILRQTKLNNSLYWTFSAVLNGNQSNIDKRWEEK